MPARPKTGFFYLIGAGPGDPELLTLKAARILQTCDVVLYDRLVGADILKLVRAGAELIYVGKNEGQQEKTQQQIFDLILEHARAGKIVIRLKGGDPMIFGRGGEEWSLARQHGIPTELIPGVSSATSVPGLAGIPLTYRQISNGFAVITANQKDGEPNDWAKYVAVDTLVILMGVNNRARIAQSLINAGRNPAEPVAFIERGSLPAQRLVLSTLADVASTNVQVESPAVIVIGQVVHYKN